MSPSSKSLEFAFNSRDVIVAGQAFKLKELSVAENDACLDIAKEPDGGINGRLHMRTMICKSVAEPKLTIDDIAGFPNRVYLALAEAVNDLNSVDDAQEPEEDGTGNA